MSGHLREQRYTQEISFDYVFCIMDKPSEFAIGFIELAIGFTEQIIAGLHFEEGD